MYVQYVGLDLGQTQDPSALVLLERPVWYCDPFTGDTGWRTLDHVQSLRFAELSRRSEELHVRALRRYPLGTTYTTIVADVGRLLGTLPYPQQTALLIDWTGVGRPVFDMFVDAGLNPIGISIHGGDKVIPVDGGFRTPKRDLVGAVKSLLSRYALKFAADLPLLDVLRGELENFHYKLDPLTSHDSYSAWRENLHDDTVLAVAIAAWFAERQDDTRAFVTAYAPPARFGRVR